VIIGSDATVSAYSSGTALTVAAGPYNITNSGQIVSNQDNIDTSQGDGINVDGPGTIVNNGTITSANDGVLNDSTSDTSYLYNYGTISGENEAVYDTGSHVAVLFNYGDVFGSFAAVLEDSQSYVINSGSISGGVYLSGADSSLVNSGAITGSSAYPASVILYGANSSLVNSGSISGGVSLEAGGITLDSTLGTIAGGITCSGDVVIAGQTGGTVIGGSGNDVLYANPTQTAADNAAHTILDGGGGNNWLFGDGAYTTFDSGDNTAGTYNQFFGEPSQMAGVSGYTNNTLSYATLGDQGEGYKSVYVDLLDGDAYMSTAATALSGPYTFEDYITDVPNVIGSPGGGDVIECDDGVDRITNGGAGGNVMIAGTGASSQDTFVYTALTDSPLSDYDIIAGFKVGTDKIDLSALNVPLADILLSYGGSGSNTVYVEQNPTAGFNAATDMIISVQASTNAALSYKDIIG
jgi:hypothetical protein